MEREQFVKKFAKRLKLTLKEKGYISNRSKSGVTIGELAKVGGVSFQMASKYITGLALPDYHMIPVISNWLNVSPSWLLFGESEVIKPKFAPSTLLEIDLKLLEYILQKCTVLFSLSDDSKKIANYVAGAIYDASHIDADFKTIIQCIDMMLTSAVQLTEIKQFKRA